MMSRLFRDLHSWITSSSSRSSSRVKLSLSSTSCGWGGARGGKKNRSDGSAEARGPSRQRPTGGARGAAGAAGDRPNGVATRRRRRETPRDARRVAIRVVATPPRRRPREGRVVGASGEKMSNTIADGGRATRVARVRSRRVSARPGAHLDRGSLHQSRRPPEHRITRVRTDASPGASRSANRVRGNRDESRSSVHSPAQRARASSSIRGSPGQNPSERAIENPRVSSRLSRSTAIFKPNFGEARRGENVRGSRARLSSPPRLSRDLRLLSYSLTGVHRFFPLIVPANHRFFPLPANLSLAAMSFAGTP